MSAEILDRSYFFAERRLQADIARIRSIADKAASDIQAESERKRRNIEALLDRMVDDVKWRMPCDGEAPFQ